ncbi:MAG: sulfatase [Planctomycetales bacterium]|nr:sulfatase [Planctomycetales bacterium]
MERRTFLRWMGLSIQTPLMGQLCQAAAKKTAPAIKRPNLVFIFPDQMRGQAMGFLGEEPVLTPRLDRLAAQSLTLPQTVSNYPLCSPFRAMLMSGRYPHASRVTDNCNSDTTPYDCELRTTEPCWSDILKEAGYALGYVGKWHLDAPRKPYVDCYNNKGPVAWNEWCPPDRRHGFDFWYAYGTYDQHTRPMYWATEAAREGFALIDQWGPEHEADMAIRYIRNEDGRFRKADRPFALVVSMNPPHMPYELVPGKYVDRYRDRTADDLCRRANIPPAGTRMGDLYRKNIKNYFAMITGVDEQVGRILDALDGQGLGEETIVVFTSDHGNCLGIHHEISKNNPFEESIRIPFLIRWPGKIKPRRDDALFSSLDMAPTLLDLMGFKKQIPPQMDGISFAGLFLTGEGARPEWQWYMATSADKPHLGRRGLRNASCTFILERKDGAADTCALYDNIADPYQLENIADQQPDRVKKLTAKLDRLLKNYSDPWARSDAAEQRSR